MDLFDVVRACIRRWYVVVPLLAASTFFAYQSYSSVQPVYYSNAVIGLAPPSNRIDLPAVGVPSPRNGLLDVGGAALLANMAVFGFSDPTTVARVVENGGQPYFTAKMFPSPPTAPPLPLIMLEITAPTPDLATKTVQAAIMESERVFQTLQQQAGVPDSMMVRPLVVTQPGPPVAGTPSRLRSTAFILVGCIGLSILLAVIVDVLLIRRRPSQVGKRGMPRATDSANVRTSPLANPPRG